MTAGWWRGDAYHARQLLPRALRREHALRQRGTPAEERAQRSLERVAGAVAAGQHAATTALAAPVGHSEVRAAQKTCVRGGVGNPACGVRRGGRSCEGTQRASWPDCRSGTNQVKTPLLSLQARAAAVVSQLHMSRALRLRTRTPCSPAARARHSRLRHAEVMRVIPHAQRAADGANR
jgi:hypothetical protein